MMRRNGSANEAHRTSRSDFHSVRTLGLVTLLSLACSTGNDVLVGYNRGHAGSLGTSGVASGGAESLGTSAGATSWSTAPSSTSTTTDGCLDGGPPITLPTIGGCTSDLAKRLFAFAICSCADLTVSNGLMTTPFRSSAAGVTFEASVGVNGSYLTDGARSQLGGSLWVLGDSELAGHDIQGDLQCGGSVTVTASSAVHRNAYVVGNLAAPNLSIDGSLSIADNARYEVLSVAGGTTTLASMAVPPPCDCEHPLDIGAITRHFEADNDNDNVALSSALFVNNDTNLARTLPCGRYYFDSLGGTGAITLHLTGKTLIAIGGRLSNSGGLHLDLGPDAELDLFVGGDLELSGPVALGNASRPAITRVYVGGQAAFSSNLTLYANWYIPNSLLATSAPSEFWGALFTHSLTASAGLAVHYDASVLDLPSCQPSGQSCSSCRGCANPTPACRNGTCEACLVDSDCCPPLYCNQGTCETAPVLL